MLRGTCAGAWLVLGVVACQPEKTAEVDGPSEGDGDGEGGSGAAGGADPGDGDSEEPTLFGTISVQMMEETESREALSLASGRLYDRQPRSVPRLALEQTEGQCALWVVDVPQCPSSCEAGTHCVEDDVCEPYPEAQDAGPLWIGGLSDERVALESLPPSFIYQSESLPYPPCNPGDSIELGGDALRARSECIEPLRVSWDPILVRREMPVLLEWQAATDPDRAAIHVLLDVSHHGGKAGEIVCDGADVGSLEIPAPLVTSLIDLGLAGFPSVFLTRRATSPTNVESVIFEVASTVQRPVDTGVTSCLSDSDCPSGQTCDRERVVCSP